MYSRIIGTGSYLPEKVITNHDLEKLMDTSDQWIRERTGIQERRIAADDQTTGDLAVEACRKAIEAADIDPAEIDLVLLGTTTPDLIFPSTACLIYITNKFDSSTNIMYGYKADQKYKLGS